MAVDILGSNPGTGGFVLGPFLPFPCDGRLLVAESMDASLQQFALDGLAEDETDSVLVCEEENEEEEEEREVSRILSLSRSATLDI